MILSRLSPSIRGSTSQLLRREASSLSDLFAKSHPPGGAAPRKQFDRTTKTTEFEKPREDNSKTNGVKKSFFTTPLGEMKYQSLRNCRHKIHYYSKDKSSGGAEWAERHLARLVDEATATSKKLVGVVEYNLCLDAWANSGDRRAFAKCGGLLRSMVDLHEKHPGFCPAPNEDSYNLVLNACGRVSHPAAVKLAEETIRAMEKHSQPTTWSYNTVILTHANRAEEYGAASTAEDWLKHLSKVGAEGGACPDTTSFNCVLKAWSLSQENRGADRALELFNLMVRLYKDGNKEVKPDVYSAASVVNAMSRRNRPEEAESALKMALEFLNGQGPPSDMTMCCNSAINAWAKSSGRPDAPERAYDLLRDMRSLYSTNCLANVFVEPDVVSYTSCLEAIARSGRPDAPEIAEARLMEMVEDSVRRVPGSVAPNRATFDCVIRAWFRSEKPNKGERVEELIDLMLKLAREHGMKCRPLHGTVNMCISAKCRSKQLHSAVETLTRFEKLRLVDALSYTNIIDAFLREEQYREKNVFGAARVLERMHKQLVAGRMKKWPENSLDLYDRVLSAIGKLEGSDAAADLAYGILRALQASETNHNTPPGSPRPTVEIYASVMATLAKVPTGARDIVVEELFGRIRTLHHDAGSPVTLHSRAFAAILLYYANVGQTHAAAEACRVLEEMHTLYNEGVLTETDATSLCYDRCLMALARCGDRHSVFSAVKLLKTLVQSFKEKKIKCLPLPSGFRCVLKYSILLNNEEAKEWTNDIHVLVEDLKKAGHVKESLKF